MQKRRRTGAIAATISCLAATSCVHWRPSSGLQAEAAAETACRGSASENKAIVLAFYETALVDRRVRAAFERYAAPDFVEHKPDVEKGTRAATIDFLEGLISHMPDPHWEIIRSIAEGDYVSLHVRFTPAPGAPAYAIADIFRLDDCRIVEHWDVVAQPPDVQKNPNSRF